MVTPTHGIHELHACRIEGSCGSTCCISIMHFILRLHFLLLVDQSFVDALPSISLDSAFLKSLSNAIVASGASIGPILILMTRRLFIRSKRLGKTNAKTGRNETLWRGIDGRWGNSSLSDMCNGCADVTMDRLCEIGLQVSRCITSSIEDNKREVLR